MKFKEGDILISFDGATKLKVVEVGKDFYITFWINNHMKRLRNTKTHIEALYRKLTKLEKVLK